MSSCTEQESSAPREVQFTVSTAASADGRVSAVVLPPGTALLLSIRKSTGETVLTHERVTLLKVGGQYITEPLSLHPGDYAITDFMLVDAASEVLYATPLANSPLAGAVSHPLPYAFTVSADVILNIDMQVLAVGTNTPENFGYTSFGIDINTGNLFSLSVFIPGADGLELTGGEAFIMSGYDTLYRYTLAAETNMIPFYGDTTQTYTLIVTQSGYTRYLRQFVYAALKDELAGQPLEVVLVPAFTMVIWSTQFMGYYSRWDYYGDQGVLNVDIGLLNSNFAGGYDMGPFSNSSVEVNYEAPGRYFSTVTGDLDELKSIIYTSPVDSIDVRHVPNLTGLGLRSESRVRRIDLTHNHKLEELYLSGIGTLRDVTIPSDNRLNNVRLQNTGLSSASITVFIDNLHLSAVTHNEHNGTFYFSGTASPSPAALTQLKRLQNDYGWDVAPHQ